MVRQFLSMHGIIKYVMHLCSAYLIVRKLRQIRYRTYAFFVHSN